eukprot:TRINITY_DN9710_c0_g1_i3.p1 TRINITY_DN9710_c0_g1~~TRINITY_DN9710_c0_g1_i3.p1  ORF type:complete len:192 (+),score=55.74 TRINITY_DN9710_c0_g1_i3:55-630(+)
MVKAILMIVGDFVEDYEAMIPFQMCQLLGYEIHAVSPGKSAGQKIKTAIHDFEGDQTYTEKPGHNFALNATFDDLKLEHYAGVYLPGGRAPEFLRMNPRVLEVVKHFAENNKPIAAICHGIQILTAAGIVQGKQCTAYPACRFEVDACHGIWNENNETFTNAVVDGNLVTAGAWPAHPALMKAFFALIGSP